MATNSEFAHVVATSLARGGATAQPRAGEIVLAGEADSTLVRMRIPGRYRPFEPMLTRSFIRRKQITRLAIVRCGPVAAPSGQSKFVVRVLDRDVPRPDATGNDAREARVAAAAWREWHREPEPLFELSGRPWPVVLLVAALGLDLVVGLERFALEVSGRYAWLPAVPATVSMVLHVLYLALLVATMHQLWNRTRAGYVLATVLAASQVLRAAVLVPGEVAVVSPAGLAWWLVGALLLPALIAICFLLLYQARPRAA